MRSLNWITALAALMILLGGVQLIYWRYFDAPELSRIDLARVENPNDIHPDGHLLLHTKGCVFRPAVPGSAVRAIRNAYVYVLADNAVLHNSGCYEVTRDYPIPPSAVLGPHAYQICADYQVNPVKVTRFCGPPVPFEVTPPR